jgi:hypothetical protein
MEDRKFELRWVGYCEANNKVWGWFVDANKERGKSKYAQSECYCFWSVVGKTISMNKHSYRSWDMEALEKKKLANKYELITQDQLIEMWPNFQEDLNNRFVFATLAGTV